MGDATSYSKALLEAFLSAMPVRTDGLYPTVSPSEITHDRVRALRGAMLDLSSGALREAAISDLENFNRDGAIQTSGVGLADSFNAFVNLGLLLGSRVVLWDTVLQGAVFGVDGRISPQNLAETSVSFLMLADAIENGHVVMLPHPVVWLERCQRYLASVHGLDGLTPEFCGYLHSRALLDEGFGLHPYSLRREQRLNGRHASIESAINLMAEEERRQGRTKLVAEDLLFDTQFDFLLDLETRQLSGFLKEHRDWRDELNLELDVPDFVQSEADLARHMRSVKKGLLTGIQAAQEAIQDASRKKRFRKWGLLGAATTKVGAAIGLSAAYAEGSILGVVGAGIGIFGTAAASVPALLQLSKVVGKPAENTISLYQGFSILDDMNRARRELQKAPPSKDWR